MSERKSLLFSFLGLSLPIFFYLLPSPDTFHSYRLVIAVSSRLENVQNRKIIRSTWKNSLPSSVLFKFLVSESSCSIDPLWRIDQDGCEAWEVSVPNWVQEGTVLAPFSLVDNSPMVYPPYSAVEFKVKTFPVLLLRIGLASHLLSSLTSNQTISLVLKTRDTGQTMTIISFSAEDKTDSGYSFKPCDGKGLELGPGFQGLLYLSGGVKNKQKCFSSFNTQLGNHGVLQITGFKKTGPGVVPRNENLCSLVNLEYSLVEPNDLKQHICARDTQNLVEGRRMKEIEKDVNIEVEDNDDIVFIPSVDSNQAAPVNLKKFLASMEESISYDYLLVTTDRSLVNIDKVLNGLTGETSWWGSFNRFLPVQDYDLRFTAVSYPPIPSPSSVLSKHLADFIARNSESLADFSDVSKSLSIWLSGLGADYVDENFWFGGPEVVNRTQLWRSGQLIVLEDLVPEEMENVWKD